VHVNVDSKPSARDLPERAAPRCAAAIVPSHIRARAAPEYETICGVKR
jgi:hypothetical protein